MLDFLKDKLSVTGDYAKRIGPKRGLVALAVIASAVGASILVRYLKGRRAQSERFVDDGHRTKPRAARHGSNGVRAE